MHCAFHPMNAATANCAGCNRPLCPSCDHRIKGYPHCEDCIVRGVDLMRRAASGAGVPAVAQLAPAPRVESHPVRATLFALIPGLGAVYNRQNFKAFFHFLGTVGLSQVAAAADMEFFGFGAAVFYVYTLIDAYRTSRTIAAGVDPREDEVRLRWMFSKYKGAWGAALIGGAAMIAVSSIATLPLGLTPARIWALVLFAAGLYLIASYFRSTKSAYEPGSTIPPVPRSIVSTTLPALSEDLSSAQSRAGSRRDGR